MRKPNLATLSVAAALALAGTAGIAAAQTPSRAGRVIEVPPGAVVLILPAGAAQAMPWPGARLDAATLDAAFPFPAMPDTARLVRQMDRMMLDTERAFANPAWTDPARTIEAAMRRMPSAEGPVSGVMVTSFSDGRGTCTQRVVYSGTGAAPKVDVSSTGNACGRTGNPVALPETQPSRRVIPHTIQVENHAGARPMEVAQLRD